MIYTPLKALKELPEKSPESVIRGLADYLNAPSLEVVEEIISPLLQKLRNNAVAVIAVNLPAPNYWMWQVGQMIVRMDGKELIILIHPDDTYTPKNKEKKAFLRLLLFDGPGRNGGPRLTRVDLVNINKAEGRPFSQIMVENPSAVEFFSSRGIEVELGMPIPEFHRRWLEWLGEKNFLPVKWEIVDFSKLISSLASLAGIAGEVRAKWYYTIWLIVGGILGVIIEDFDPEPGFEKFLYSVVVPAYHQVKELVGVYPRILRCPQPAEGLWYPYPHPQAERVEIPPRIQRQLDEFNSL